KPDLTVRSRDGKTIIVVEAKSTPVEGQWNEVIREQLRTYATEVNSPWSLVIDPDRTLIFRSAEMGHPLANLSTSEVVEATQFKPSPVWGERTLLMLVDRWLRELPRRNEWLTRHPELREFAHDV